MYIATNHAFDEHIIYAKRKMFEQHLNTLLLSIKGFSEQNNNRMIVYKFVSSFNPIILREGSL